MATVSSYLDKVFRKPEYIWQAGSAKVDLIESTIENNHVQRLQWLADRSAGSHMSDSAAVTLPETKAQQPEAPTPAPSLNDPDRSVVNQEPAKPGATRNTVVPLLSLVWNSAEPQNYQAQFRIGTDPVPFLLDLDTGSSLLWVQARLDDTDPKILDQSQYNPKTSTTANDVQTVQYVSYGDGDTVEADLYTDHVSIEKLIAKDQRIGAVRTMKLTNTAKAGKSNGLIGLGFTSEEFGLVQTLQKQGSIRYASITLVGPRNNPEKAKEIDSKVIMEPRGYLIIGSVDQKYYTGEIAWCPQISNIDPTVPNRWIIKLDAIILNGTKVFENQYALIDTGTSYILASPASFTRFRKAVGKGARPTVDYMFGYLKDSIKTVTFVLGGRQIDLHPNDISLGDLKPDREGVIRSLSSICTLPQDKWIFPENLWILGGIFIDNIVTIFDYANKKIGIADISEHDLSQEVDNTG